MKKLICLAVALLLILCGCARTQAGNPAELRQYSWTGQTKGGGRVSLRFDGDKAALTLQNGGETAVITGSCLTDDETLVIFDDASAQSYRFGRDRPCCCAAATALPWSCKRRTGANKVLAKSDDVCYNDLECITMSNGGGMILIVFGIDPGYAIVGWGAVRFRANTYQALGYGAIETQAHTDFNERLETIYDELTAILQRCRPDAVSIEKLYFQTNKTTAIKVAQARGVTLLAAQKLRIPVFEYTPLQVKTAVTGYGKAKKPQVMEMTRRLLHLDEVPKPDDTADALAIAICHAQAAGSDLRRLLNQRTI